MLHWGEASSRFGLFLNWFCDLLWLIHVKHLEQCQTLKYYWKWVIITGF